MSENMRPLLPDSYTLDLPPGVNEEEFDPGKYIKAIVPGLTPWQALSLVIAYNERVFPTDECLRGWRQMILTSGNDPDEWIYLTNNSSRETFEQVFGYWKKYFPEEIQFLITPGKLLGAKHQGTFSESYNSLHLDGSTTFIRIAPQEF